MIESLTPEQEALLPVYRDKWIKIGLDTKRADRPKTESLIKQAYEVAGIKAPTKFTWFDSPRAAQDAVRNSKHKENIWNVIYGSQEAGWLSFYDYMREVLKVEACNKLIPLIEAAKEVGWWWPFEDEVYVSEKPIMINLDNQNRLHSASDMAIEYADGWGFYCYKGVRIPKSFLHEPITVKIIDECVNAEQKRVLIELFGAPEYLRQTGAKLENEDEFGKLWSRDVGDGGDPIKVVEVINSTPEPDGTRNVYFLRVPPTVKTCTEGVAWTFGLDGDNYMPLVET